MEIIKLKNGKVTVSVPVTTYEEKVYSVENLDEKIEKLTLEVNRRKEQYEKVEDELNELLEIKQYVTEESNNNKLG